MPNLKFISPNADGKFSEICANRYTGELVIDQKILGTFNLCTDVSVADAFKDGKLPAARTGEHYTLDMQPHDVYGGTYKHVAKGIKVGELEKGPVVLGQLDKSPVGINLFVFTILTLAVANANATDNITNSLSIPVVGEVDLTVAICSICLIFGLVGRS